MQEQGKLPNQIFRVWALASVALPTGIPAVFLLLLMGLFSLSGGYVLAVGSDLLSRIVADWATLFIQLWLTAFFIAVAGYGVG